MSAWHKKLSDKLLHTYLVSVMNKQRMTYQEQQKFLSFANKFINFVFSAAEYITYILILFYFNKKVGFEKTILILGVFILVRLNALQQR